MMRSFVAARPSLMMISEVIRVRPCPDRNIPPAPPKFVRRSGGEARHVVHILPQHESGDGHQVLLMPSSIFYYVSCRSVHRKRATAEMRIGRNLLKDWRKKDGRD